MKKLILATIILGGLLFAEVPTLFRIGEPIKVDAGTTVDSVLAIGGPVVIEGAVLHDVVAVGGSVNLGEKSIIFGDLVTIGGKVTQTLGARVLKQNKIVVVAQEHQPFHFFRWVSFGWGMLALILIALFPTYIGRMATDIETKPVLMLLSGALASILIVPVAVLLVITLVGIVLIPLELAGVGVMAILGASAIAQLLGKKLLNAFRAKDIPIIVEALVGLVALWLIGLVPFVGAAVKVVLGCAGLGAVSRSWFRWVRKTPE